MSTKYEKLIALSIQVIRQDVLHGHLRWKVTELSRTSHFSRSRIYELLGASKPMILRNALVILLEEMYGLSAERQEFDKKHSQFEGFLVSREMVITHPELLAFYFRNRNRKDEIGEIMRTNEKRFLKRVEEKTGLKDPALVLFIRTFIHGVSLAPFLDDRDVSALMRQLSKVVRAFA